MSSGEQQSEGRGPSSKKASHVSDSGSSLDSSAPTEDEFMRQPYARSHGRHEFYVQMEVIPGDTGERSVPYHASPKFEFFISARHLGEAEKIARESYPPPGYSIIHLEQRS